MPESFKSKLLRYRFNLFPAYKRTGARVSYIANDYKQIKIVLPLNWKTVNVVGTIFGGCIYASIDPMYMLMLMRILGKDYIVWDKAANIKWTAILRQS